MDADRINAQTESDNPAEAKAEAKGPQSRRMEKMLRALEYCFAENMRAEIIERYNYADEESISRHIRREFNLSDEVLDHFYEAAQSIGAIERTPRADGITLSAVSGYEPITSPATRKANAATANAGSERGDYPAAYGTQQPNGNPALIFPESTTPANLCYDPQPKIKEVEHTAASRLYKDDVDRWREEHHRRRKANLRIIAKTADWNRQRPDFHADPLADIREKIEAQIESGQARKNAARAEQRAARKRAAGKHSATPRTKDLPTENDGYVIPGCGFAAEANADDEDGDPEQGFVPSVLTEMAAASYTEAWDM